MSNHLHIIWRITNEHTSVEVQQSFMKFTAQQMINDVKKYHPKVLPYFFVNAKDRKYQVWERNPLSIEIRSNYVFLQKLNYIHENPVKAGLCSNPADYLFSSASLYTLNTSPWDFLEKWDAF